MRSVYGSFDYLVLLTEIRLRLEPTHVRQTFHDYEWCNYEASGCDFFWRTTPLIATVFSAKGDSVLVGQVYHSSCPEMDYVCGNAVNIFPTNLLGTRILHYCIWIGNILAEQFHCFPITDGRSQRRTNITSDRRRGERISSICTSDARVQILVILC